ncbi:unnamed protein product [Arctogadus glacialis]
MNITITLNPPASTGKYQSALTVISVHPDALHSDLCQRPLLGPPARPTSPAGHSPLPCQPVQMAGPWSRLCVPT